MTGKLALVLGATGGVGGHLAAGLKARGWAVRALARAPREDGAFDWVKGDVMVAADVARAARGASVIVHAVNPPGYRRWAELVLPMLDNTIAAARAEGARILLPGTVYNFGPDAFSPPGTLIGEEAPQQPRSRKGAIRVEMERRLAAAAGSGEAKVLILRAGDYFGPGASNNWFSQGLVKPGARLSSITQPGRPGVGHQWAYLPDVARIMLDLLEQPGLPDFARFHMEGHWDADGTAMAGAIRRALGRELPMARFPWWAVGLARPAVPLFRELWEMRYLWREPVRLSNARLVALLGQEPRTPLDEAVGATLRSLGVS
ncbi:NAD(P)H-binding protein [Acetobacteraceae bacterium H6797]|nr:NAD(P)H-binding protein [Acetobacteraceae bacterium H6797]